MIHISVRFVPLLDQSLQTSSRPRMGRPRRDPWCRRKTVWSTGDPRPRFSPRSSANLGPHGDDAVTLCVPFCDDGRVNDGEIATQPAPAE